jgi:hypothetical protein
MAFAESTRKSDTDYDYDYDYEHDYDCKRKGCPEGQPGANLCKFK